MREEKRDDDHAIHTWRVRVLACASLFLSSVLLGLASLLTSAIFVTRHDGASSSTTTFQNPARSADRAALRACSSRGGGARKKAVSSVR